MIERLKNMIDYNRYDKETYNKYIEAFVNCDKAKELYSTDPTYLELSEKYNKNDLPEKKEDKYF